MNHKLKARLWAAGMFLSISCISSQAFGQTLPDGKGKAEFVHNCTACHRSDMVTDVKKTPEEWRKSVDEMAARGTDGTKEDLDNIVLYLDTYFALGTPAPVEATPSTTPASAPGGLAKLNHSDIEQVKRVIAENSCQTCHRIEHQGADTAPSLNGVGTRHTADEIRTAILSHHQTTGLGNSSPAPSYQGTITKENLDELVRYLVSLPPLPQ